MSTADSLTLVVTLAGALGAGAVLRSVVEYLLTRRDREARLSERLVYMSDIQIKRLEAALAEAREEIAMLRGRPERDDGTAGARDITR